MESTPLGERGLKEKGGGLFTKSNDKEINSGFSSPFIQYLAESTYNFACQIHKFDTVFIPYYIKINLKTGLAK